ncbi:MAG: 50S ribosomal protein L29 [Actinomycetia bacterium]|nr:50S ribosomal protein L29 [Actinomycetes bacterium]
MKTADIRDLSDEELDKKMDEAKEALFNLRFQLATGQLDNFMSIKESRRLIARLQTIRRERELEGAKAEKNSD